MNFAKCLYICVLVLLVISCSDDKIINEQGKPIIDKVIPENTWVGDTLTIYGSYFGDPSITSFLVFDNQNIINSTKCLKWTISQIKVIVPLTSSSEVMVIVDQDSSNKYAIKVSRLPKIECVEISSGSFIMGSNYGLKDELPVHTVQISSPFLMSIYEINQFVYEQVMGTNPSIVKDHKLPVDSVNWIDAIQFCNKLSEIDGLTPAYQFFGENVTWNVETDGWRLPTESEWEYACRAGTQGEYSGDWILDDLGWYNMNSGMHSHPSGRKTGNLWGLFDMNGNLWEWCWDFYADDYYNNSSGTDPKGPDSGSRHVARGGSWNEGNIFARSSNRSYPDNSLQSTGFRIVRTIKK
ncbi:MAG TPA: hypothetical protein DCW42_09925 [Bacteroidetes bacterium]|nr:hypothetical protein [Bacteroidota bacterium]